MIQHFFEFNFILPTVTFLLDLNNLIAENHSARLIDTVVGKLEIPKYKKTCSFI